MNTEVKKESTEAIQSLKCGIKELLKSKSSKVLLENLATKQLILDKNCENVKGKLILSQVQNALNIYKEISNSPPSNDKLIIYFSSKGIAKDHDEEISFLKLKGPVLINMLEDRIYELLDSSDEFTQFLDELTKEL
jgi:hypothetical protein